MFQYLIEIPKDGNTLVIPIPAPISLELKHCALSHFSRIEKV